MRKETENKTKSNWYKNFKSELNLLSRISFSIFLFILFFQPFDLNKLHFNDQLIFIAGLGAIVFILVSFSRYIFAGQIRKLISGDTQLADNSFYSGLFFIVLNTVAFTFYLRYVGKAETSFYLVFKIFIISVIPPLIFYINDLIQDLKNQNQILRKEIKMLQERIKTFSEEDNEKQIALESLNRKEKLEVYSKNILFISSADNYVKITYRHNSDIKYKLLRNTLKNIEIQLNHFPNFLRCHRAYIVNMDFAQKVKRKYNSYFIDLKGIDTPLPVSRQYLIRIKEAIPKFRDE